jgi:tRNA (guanine37-N1)-methyltransferase
MLAAYTNLKNAQKLKKELIDKKLMHKDYLSVKEMDLIYFPLKSKSKLTQGEIKDVKFKFPAIVKKPTIEQLLDGKMSNKEIKLLPKSQEIVGDILILEIPEELKQYEKIIAQAYLNLKDNIKTVVKKAEEHSGVYRLRKLKHLAGERKKETIHRENGIILKLGLEKTYYSARSSGERLRIAKQVQDNEEVMVMFSGAAPFPLVIVKNAQPKKVYGVEINPEAHIYALENVELNNMEDRINLYLGDVRIKLPQIKKKYNRIVMPLPMTGEEFLGLALKYCQDKGTIHLYAFINETEIENEAKRIKKYCQDSGYKVKILNKVKCGQFSPGIFRTCFDIKLT